MSSRFDYTKLIVLISTFAVLLQDFRVECRGGRGGARGGSRGYRHRTGGGGGTTYSSVSGLRGQLWLSLAVVGGVTYLSKITTSTVLL